MSRGFVAYMLLGVYLDFIDVLNRFLIFIITLYIKLFGNEGYVLVFGKAALSCV